MDSKAEVTQARVPCPHEHVEYGKLVCGLVRCPDGDVMDDDGHCTIPAPPAPAEEPLPAGWERWTDPIAQVEQDYRHIESGCTAWRWDDECEWIASRPRDERGSADMIGRTKHPTRAAAIAACEAWVMANTPRAEASGIVRDDGERINVYTCPACAEKEAERDAACQERDIARNQRGEWKRLHDATEAECTRLTADLATQRDEGNRAHDALQAHGVPFAERLSHRVTLLIEHDDEATEQARHFRVAARTAAEERDALAERLADINRRGMVRDATMEAAAIRRADGWRTAWVMTVLAAVVLIVAVARCS